MSELVVRPATPEDLADLGRLLVLARAAAVPQMPPSVHPPALQRARVEGWDLNTHQVWVAEHDGQVAGVARFTETWLDDLYVHPAHQAGGVGSVLLETVQALRPAGFGLWVFLSNRSAQRFYARHGFVEVSRTDGSGNEEQAPEIELRWP